MRSPRSGITPQRARVAAGVPRGTGGAITQVVVGAGGYAVARAGLGTGWDTAFHVEQGDRGCASAGSGFCDIGRQPELLWAYPRRDDLGFGVPRGTPVPARRRSC